MMLACGYNRGMRNALGDPQDDDLIRDGITAVKSGNRGLAVRLLERAARRNPLDARPWLWLTETTDDLTEKQEYLERAVAADPQNALLRRALVALRWKLDSAAFAPSPAETKTPMKPAPEGEPIAARTGQTFQCPKCGGHLDYDLETERLTCIYCGFAPEMEPERSAADAEQSFYAALPTERGHLWAMSQQQLRCERCGAVSLWPPGQRALECPYCGSRQIIESAETRALIDPQGIAIMQVDETEAARRVQAWFGRGWFTPGDLAKAAFKHTFHPAYYPFWTFDGILEMHWSCDVRETSMIRHEEWVSHTGVENEIFNDVLIPGLKRLDFKKLHQLGPYNLLDMVAFKPEYLAGWPALAYDLPMSKASLQARERVTRQLRRELPNRVYPGRQKRNLQTGGLNWLEMTYKYVLLPLWIGTYTYQDKRYRVYVNGQTGKVAGEKPRDQGKMVLTIFSSVLAALVALAFLILGAMKLGWLPVL